MPDYYFKECKDRHLHHKRFPDANTGFWEPCIGVHLKIEPDRYDMGQAVFKYNQSRLKRIVHSCSRTQWNCLMSREWLPRLGVDIGTLASEPREITRCEGGQMVLSEEQVYSIGTKIRIYNGARVSAYGHLSQRSKLHPIEFLVAENLPKDYIYLGWNFIQCHFRDEITAYTSHTNDRERTIYQFSARDPNQFCDIPSAESLVSV